MIEAIDDVSIVATTQILDVVGNDTASESSPQEALPLTYITSYSSAVILHAYTLLILYRTVQLVSMTLLHSSVPVSRDSEPYRYAFSHHSACGCCSMPLFQKSLC